MHLKSVVRYGEEDMLFLKYGGHRESRLRLSDPQKMPREGSQHGSDGFVLASFVHKGLVVGNGEVGQGCEHTVRKSPRNAVGNSENGLGNQILNHLSQVVGMGSHAKKCPCLHLFVPTEIEGSRGHDTI